MVTYYYLLYQIISYSDTCIYTRIDLLAWELPRVSEMSKAIGAVEWPRHYAALLEYAKEHGHCNVPWNKSYECLLPGMGDGGSDFAYSGKLGPWLQTQRRMKKGTKGNKRLTDEREAQLQTLVDQGRCCVLL